MELSRARRVVFPLALNSEPTLIHCRRPMKRPQRPFTFEVKRSRLPSRPPSAFQRYVVEIERTPVSKPADLAELSTAGANEAPCQPMRVLPDLSGERVWTEDAVPLPPQRFEPINTTRNQEEPAQVLASAPASQSRPHGEPSSLVVRPSGKVRLRAKTVQELPRGQRWKRRLPQAAW